MALKIISFVVKFSMTSNIKIKCITIQSTNIVILFVPKRTEIEFNFSMSHVRIPVIQIT